jgi:putative restriction endonuclease
VNAWVAVTDGDWFRFLARLARKQPLEEVNFWQPNPWGGAFKVLGRGEPLLFKLKRPHYAIAGGGFFAHYTEMPMSLAWSAFGSLNGAGTQDEVWTRIARLRRVEAPWWEDFTIGCILLAEPFFWPEELWIPQPSDFSPQIVRGKSYDLTRGVGRQLWDQVLQRLEAGPVVNPPPGDQEELPLVLPGGHVERSPTRRRIGQGTFRIVVTDAYGRRCAVTQEKALPVLDAAHIRPFSDIAVHDVRNGLLLRSDVHRLFDAGYLTVTPQLRMEASGRLRDDFDDGRTYLQLHGHRVRVPEPPDLQPDPEALRWHNENRFRG